MVVGSREGGGMRRCGQRSGVISFDRIAFSGYNGEICRIPTSASRDTLFELIIV
jgi:hypothetical protein